MVICASIPATAFALAGEECYCAMDKGAINEGHVLLLPIEHYASSLACSANAWAEMQRYLSAFKACAASQVTSPCPTGTTPTNLLPPACLTPFELHNSYSQNSAYPLD